MRALMRSLLSPSADSPPSPATRPRLRFAALAAPWLLGAGVISAVSWATASSAQDVDAMRGAQSPSLAQCRERIAISGAQIDRDCLRRVYNLPIEQWPRPQLEPGALWSEFAPLPRAAPYPADNPPSAEKLALGRRLFEDPRLSGSGQIACASCHDRELGWGDGRSVPFGHDRRSGRRNAISLAMSGLSQPLFWDGRAQTLEAQALHPIIDPREMAAKPSLVLKRLRRDADYPKAFAAAFGSSRIDMDQVSKALATFQRSLLPRANRFDRFLEGRRDLLDDRQLWGLHLFRTRAGCMNCHSGASLSDQSFHNLGLHFYGRKLQDLGRYEVTGLASDTGKFKTPSLRNVARTGPWMHNGRFANLRGVMNLYNAGMPRPRPTAAQVGDPLFPQPDPLLKPLDLHRAELDAIVAYLETL